MDALSTAPTLVADASRMIDTATLVPPDSPLAMPVQSFREGQTRNPGMPTAPHGMRSRRALVIGIAAGLTLFTTYQIWWLLRGDGISVLEGLLLCLFVPLFAWIVQSFVGTLAGFFLVVSRRHRRLGLSGREPIPALRGRTAMLMPTYNEDPLRLMAGLQAIIESVASAGQIEQFDFFVLSDTRKPDIQAAEEIAFVALRDRVAGTLGDGARLYYRRRDDNSERKAGNVADWVRRWGADYPLMLILDADSLMTGDTILRIAGAMEAHDDVALIQTLPVIVNGSTLFARMQQFAGRVYGPVIAYGVAWWHGAESNYWGHNAIIRTHAFAEHCGLPELHGIKPFGGHILSHDFVEAALLRRGGWALHMVPALAGSYEEGPPSLTDMLVRDRRWCQGNLQHGGVLPASGLHWVSRWHMLIGIGHYMTAPMWALLMLVGIAIPLDSAGASQGGFPLTDFSVTSYWVSRDPQRFLYVFYLTMSMLLAPKLLGYIATVALTEMRRGCGGAMRALIGILLETILAALMAPVTMWVQSRGLAEVLAGKDSGWDSQRRDDGSLPFSSLVRNYGGMTVFGIGAAIAAYLVSPALAAWMSPVLAGLVLSIPIVMLTSARGPGQWLRRRRIFSTPEEIAPPDVLVRAGELRSAIAAGRPA